MTSVINTGISIKNEKIITIFLHGINSITDIHQSVDRVRTKKDVEFKVNQMTVKRYRTDYKELNDMIRSYGLKKVLYNMFPKTNTIDIDLADVKVDVISQLEKIVDVQLDEYE